MKLIYSKNPASFVIVFIGCNIIHFSLRTTEVEHFAQGLNSVASNKQIITGTTPLMQAVIKRDWQKVHKLLSEKTTTDTINQQDNQENTALHYAAMRMRQICTKRFHAIYINNKCKRHRNIKPDKHVISPKRFQQRQEQKINAINALINNGARKNIKNNKGKTAYDIAKETNNSSEVINALKS